MGLEGEYGGKTLKSQSLGPEFDPYMGHHGVSLSKLPTVLVNTQDADMIEKLTGRLNLSTNKQFFFPSKSVV